MPHNTVSTRMTDMASKTWFSLSVILLATWACLADPPDRLTHSMSAHRSASTRSRRMIGGIYGLHVPWQAMIYLSDNLLDGGFAGGALICDRWVLTAGRNLFVNKSREGTEGKTPLIPKVYLGISDRAQAVPSNQYEVEKVVLHPDFQLQSEWDNDLALIQLKEPVTISNRVVAITLSNRDLNLITEEVGTGVISGWGYGALLTPASSLKHLVLPLATNSECKEEYEQQSNRPVVNDKMLCTGPSEYSENVCFGDAGGALVVRDPKDGSVYAAGILSFDKACTLSKHAVYTKISAYLPWIYSVLRGDIEGSSTLRETVVTEMYKWMPQATQKSP